MAHTLSDSYCCSIFLFLRKQQETGQNNALGAGFTVCKAIWRITVTFDSLQT